MELIYPSCRIFLLMTLHLIHFETVAADEVFSYQSLTPIRLHLTSKHSFSVTLKLHKDKDSTKTANHTLEYVVIAPSASYYGIMAVIQKMYLRSQWKYEVIGNTLPECRDFIQFSREDKNESSSKICGFVGEGDMNYNSSEITGSRVYYDEGGKMRLKFHIDSNILESDTDWIPPEVVIVFTAYTNCPNTDVGIGKLKRCSITEPISCILSPLFCDGKIDCGFEAEEFGLDEANCFLQSGFFKNGIVIILFAVFIVLMIYCCVYWIKKNYRKQ